MPGINGIKLAEKIQGKYPRTNLIYITGFTEYAFESYKTFASAFLAKPITKKALKRHSAIFAIQCLTSPTR